MTGRSIGRVDKSIGGEREEWNKRCVRYDQKVEETQNFPLISYFPVGLLHVTAPRASYMMKKQRKGEER